MPCARHECGSFGDPQRLVERFKRRGYELFFQSRRTDAIPVLLSVLLAAAACNKDGEITLPDSKPRITLDSETGVYAAKIGHTVTITPTVENEGDAAYSWTIDDEVVSTERVFEHAFSEEGRVYVTLRVENRAGYDEKEARIDVNRLAPPIISLIVPPTGLYVLTGREYTFAPEVQNGENARYEWYLDDSSVPVSTEKDYIFMRTLPGDCTLRLTAANEDGTAEKTLAVHVVDVIPVRIAFIPSSYSADPLVRSVSLGRTLFLRPQVADAVGPEYTWYVDGTLQEGATDRMFAFTPEKEGEYEVTFRVTDTDESPLAPLSRHITRASSKRITEETLRVTCYERESERVITTTGQPAADRVLEFLPAPGQFVNEKDMAGYTGQKSFEEARLYAENRLKKGEFVSLGNFGGYVILAFDHSVENKGGYDFSIPGNQFEGSNEPGVVWVMQDVNGNGKPDDEWYELRGSETGNEWTTQEYAVTYYRPGGPRQGVKWTDNLNRNGQVAYLEQFHPQDYYYPLWLEEESHTYYGTGLRQNTTQDPGGDWSNNSFEWGYVDNAGSDNLDSSGKTGKTYFKIANAMTPDGQPAGLRYIDFIKVQSAVNGSAGGLGELSTEVAGMAVDENLNR